MEDEPSREKPAAPLEEATQQWGSDAEGWAGDDVIRAAREAQVPRVRLHHHHGIAEAAAEVACPPRVEFNRNDPRTPFDKGSGDRAGSRSDVDNERARVDRRFSDEALRPLRSELMPSPLPPRPGHGGGS